jgi:hypothetical protein
MNMDILNNWTLPIEKDHIAFLFEVPNQHGLEVPLMGNDISFAQGTNDPTLNKIYGTVDAYFSSYSELEEMLGQQRKVNTDAPVGAAEFQVADTEATLRTMLALETAYFDLYMFRGGSQFGFAAKTYEQV